MKISRKSSVDLVALIIIGLLLISVAFIFQTTDWIKKFAKIKSHADIFIEINDNTAGFVSLLRSKTGEFSNVDILACEAESISGCGGTEEINEFANRMDIAIILLDDAGEVKKTFGRRKLGNMIFTTIPLPNGGKSRIGIRTDIEVPLGTGLGDENGGES
jgi:hypothetical protein